MLCINKRLYRPRGSSRSNRPGRPNRSNGSDRPHGSSRSHRSDRPDRTGGPGSAVPVSIFYAAAGGNHRNEI